MKKLNFVVQSVLIGCAIALTGVALINSEMLFWLLLLQLVVGLVQYSVSTVFKFVKKESNVWVSFHWWGSTALLLMLLLNWLTGFLAGQVFLVFAGVILPWVMAVLFWYISYNYFKKDIQITKYRFLNVV